MLLLSWRTLSLLLFLVLLGCHAHVSDSVQLLLVQSSLGHNDTHIDLNLVAFDTTTNNQTTLVNAFFRLPNDVTFDELPTWRCGVLGQFVIAAGTWREPSGELNASLSLISVESKRSLSFPIEPQFTNLVFDSQSGALFFTTNGSSIIQQFYLNAGIYSIAFILENTTSSFGPISYRHFAFDSDNQMLYAAGTTTEGGWVLAKLDMVLGNSTIYDYILKLGDSFVLSINDLTFGTIYGSGYPIAALSLSNSEYLLAGIEVESGKVIDPDFETMDGPFPPPLVADGTIVYFKRGTALFGASMNGEGWVYINSDFPDFIGIGLYN